MRRTYIAELSPFAAGLLCVRTASARVGRHRQIATRPPLTRHLSLLAMSEPADAVPRDSKADDFSEEDGLVAGQPGAPISHHLVAPFIQNPANCTHFW